MTVVTVTRGCKRNDDRQEERR